MQDRLERIPEATAVMLGRLEGRLVALDERVDRYEDMVTIRLQSLETKLDAVSDSISQGLGGVRVFHWVGGVALAVGGFVANHLWRQHQ